MSHKQRLLIVSFLFWCLSGCRPSDPIVAEVNGQPIRASEIKQCFDSLPESAKKVVHGPDGRLKIVDSVILKKMTMIAAASEGIKISPQQMAAKSLCDTAVLYEKALKHGPLRVSDAEVAAFKNELSRRQIQGQAVNITGDLARRLLLNQRFSEWIKLKMTTFTLKKNKQAIEQLRLK